MSEELCVDIVDISRDKKYVQELIALGGKRQIPCLDIHGEALYESQKIMEWLEAHKEELKKQSCR